MTVERGEFVSIVGFMGCGKSTLLNLLAGVTQAGQRHDQHRRNAIGRHRETGVYRVSELLAAPVVLGGRERPACCRRRPSAVVPRRAEGSVGALSASGRSRQRTPPPAEPAFRRNAAAGRHRPRIRDRSRSAVSRRAVWRARRADAREPSAGARASLLGGRASGHHGHDYE